MALVKGNIDNEVVVGAIRRDEMSSGNTLEVLYQRHEGDVVITIHEQRSDGEHER